jgi:competence protein ComEA
MLNLTRQERMVINFLVTFFLIGGLIQIYKGKFKSISKVDYTSSEEESKIFKEMAMTIDSMYTLEESKVQPEKNDRQVRQEKKLVNINTATKEELMQIPNIGPVTAERIILFRIENDGFKSIDELLKVKGIGEKTLEKIRGEVTIE